MNKQEKNLLTSNDEGSESKHNNSQVHSDNNIPAPPQKRKRILNRVVASTALVIAVVLGMIYAVFFYNVSINTVFFSLYMMLIILILLVVPYTVLKKELPPIFSDDKSVYGRILVLLFVLLTLLAVSFRDMSTNGYIGFVIFGIVPVTLYIILDSEIWSKFGLLTFLFMPFVYPVSLLIDTIASATFAFSKFRLNVSKSQKTNRYFSRIILALIISVPFVVLLTYLLAMTDPAFKEIVLNALNYITYYWGESLRVLLRQLIVWVVVSAYLFGTFMAVWQNESYTKELFALMDIMKHAKAPNKKWDVLIVSIILFMMNLVFVVYLYVQWTYFFGGETNILGENAAYTYANFAKKAFWEVVYASMFIYALIYFFATKTLIVTKIQKIIFNSNLAFTVFSTFVLLISAIDKFNLYTRTYGLTVSRHVISVVYAWIIIGFVLLVVAVGREKPFKFLFKWNSIALLLFVLYFVIVPVPYVVARQNKARLEKTGRFDVVYNMRLSRESVPVWIEILNNKDLLEKLGEDKSAYMFDYTYAHYWNLVHDKRLSSWRAINISNEMIKNQFPTVLEHKSEFKGKSALLVIEEGLNKLAHSDIEGFENFVRTHDSHLNWVYDKEVGRYRSLNSSKKLDLGKHFDDENKGLKTISNVSLNVYDVQRCYYDHIVKPSYPYENREIRSDKEYDLSKDASIHCSIEVTLYGRSSSGKRVHKDVYLNLSYNREVSKWLFDGVTEIYTY